MENNLPARKQTEEFVTLTDLWRLCRANWSWFVVSVLFSLIVASYYLAVTPSIYKREAAILVKQDNQSMNSGKSSDSDLLSDVSVVQQKTNVPNVQRQLVSLKVLSEVVRRLDMAETEVECLKMAQGLAGRLKTLVPDEKSSIITLSITDTSPIRAEQILDTTVQVFNEHWLADKNKIAATTSSFIGGRLVVLQSELGAIDDNISNFKANNKITDIERISDLYLQQQSASDAQILTLTNQKSIVQYILTILGSTDSQRQLLPTNTGINNATAEVLITQYNSLLLQLKNSSYNTSSQNPLIVKQESDLAELRGNIIATIKNHVRSLDIQLAAYTKASSQASSKITQNPTHAKHLLTIEREQKVKESLYLYLLQKKEETEIGTTYTSFITEMIDQPHGSDSPTSPNRSIVYFAAILMGLLIPTGILFVREIFDNTVRDRSDIERRSNLTLLGDVPLYEYDSQRGRIARIFGPLSKLVLRFWPGRRRKRRNNPLVVQPGKQDLVNEAFRVIRTNLEFMTSKHGNNNVYIVTSNYPGSGKTFVSMNLALALAIKDKRVLLVDGDLRHASTSRNFKAPKVGLSDYLAYKVADIEQALLHYAEYPTLAILPVGTIPPNPTELLASDRFGEMIEELRPCYDFIIIDSPPTDTMADADIIERQADRTLFVIRAGLFERSRVEDLEADVQNGKYKNMAVILNGAKLSGRYGYKYGYKNGYQYSYHNDDEMDDPESESRPGCGRKILSILLRLAICIVVLYFVKSCVSPHLQSDAQQKDDMTQTDQEDPYTEDPATILLPSAVDDTSTVAESADIPVSASDETETEAAEQQKAQEVAATEQKKQAEAELKRKQEAERKKQAEAEQKKQAELKRKQEAEQKKQAEAEQKHKQAAEQKKQSEADQKRKQAAEQKKQAEAEQKRKQAAEQKKQAEAEQKRKQAAEQKKQAEAEQKRKQAAEQKKQAEAEQKRKQEAEQKKQAEAAAAASNSSYSLVLGCFSSRTAAENAMTHYANSGASGCYIVPSGSNFRVCYSSFKTKDEANAKRQQLKSKGADFANIWILQTK